MSPRVVAYRLIRCAGVCLAVGGASLFGSAATACPGLSTAAISARFAEARSLCGHNEAREERSGSEIAAERVELPRSVAIRFPNVSPATAARARVAAARIGPNPHAATIVQVARRYRIDPALLHAIVRQESGFNQAARSGKGALGLMQLMPGTARDLGVRDPSRLTRDPELNLATGAAYLKKLQAQLGNHVPTVLAAYNAGPGAVRRYRGIPPYRETRAYVRSIMASYGRARGAGR